MKIIIGVGHPKDVHTFKNLYYRLVDRGHQCLVASNDRQHNIELLQCFQINHICYSGHSRSLAGKIRFGSQVDLILPREYVIQVREGDQIHAGLSIIAKK